MREFCNEQKNAYFYRKLINDYWFETVSDPQNFDECDQYLDGKDKKEILAFSRLHY